MDGSSISSLSVRSDPNIRSIDLMATCKPCFQDVIFFSCCSRFELKMYGPPVDLSFKELSSVAGALAERPRSLLRPLTTNSNGKYLSRSLRLSNNSLADLVGLQYTLSHFIAEPSKLGWLDLSFNKITCIEPVLRELKELRVLYLHGNSIWNLSEVDKLGELQHLHTITLHGNAIETSKSYRNYVICALPQLKTMDFSGVTRSERAMANIWHRRTKRGKNTRENKLDPDQ